MTKELEAWMSAEGVLTGARQVKRMEFDSNWKGAFRVTLVEWLGDTATEFVGEGPCAIGGLGIAIKSALAKAAGEVR